MANHGGICNGNSSQTLMAFNSNYASRWDLGWWIGYNFSSSVHSCIIPRCWFVYLSPLVNVKDIFNIAWAHDSISIPCDDIFCGIPDSWYRTVSVQHKHIRMILSLVITCSQNRHTFMHQDCDAYRFRLDIAVECWHIVYVNGERCAACLSLLIIILGIMLHSSGVMNSWIHNAFH